MSTLPTPPPGIGDAQIFESGYRSYSGQRLGGGSAIRAVAVQAFKHAMGIGRSGKAKILPIIIVVLSYVPGIVLVGVTALSKNLSDESVPLPAYSDYYGQVVLAVLLLVAFLAPGILCPDRRTGMLGLYLASPLTRDTYLAGKAIAIITGLCLVTIGPQLLMLLANTLQGSGVGSLGDSGLMVLRILAAGLVVALLFTALSLAISSLTDRQGFATAGIILVLLACGVVGNQLAANGPATFALLDLGLQLPNALTTRIFGVRSFEVAGSLSTFTIFGAAAAWTVLLAGFARFRYQYLRVTR